jgi:shikimate kinase
VVAWLDAEPDLLFERASRSGRRPLLQTEDPRARFVALLEARRELYSEVSDFRLDSTGLSQDEAAAAVLDAALRHWREIAPHTR